MTTEQLPRNPEIRKLLESLKQMPEYLAERRLKIEAQREFARSVFEKAVAESGLPKILARMKARDEGYKPQN